VAKLMDECTKLAPLPSYMVFFSIGQNERIKLFEAT